MKNLLTTFLLFTSYVFCSAQEIASGVPDFNGNISQLVPWGDSVLVFGDFTYQVNSSATFRYLNSNSEIVNNNPKISRYLSDVISTPTKWIYLAQHKNECEDYSLNAVLYSVSKLTNTIDSIHVNCNSFDLDSNYLYFTRDIPTGFEVNRIHVNSLALDSNWNIISPSGLHGVAFSEDLIVTATLNNQQSVFNFYDNQANLVASFSDTNGLSSDTKFRGHQIVKNVSDSIFCVASLASSLNSELHFFNTDSLLNTIQIPGSISDYEIQDTLVYISGDFIVNNDTTSLIILNTNTNIITNQPTDVNGEVYNIQSVNNKLYFNGDFNSWNGMSVNGFYKCDLSFNSINDAPSWLSTENKVYYIESNNSDTMIVGVDLEKPGQPIVSPALYNPITNSAVHYNLTNFTLNSSAYVKDDTLYSIVEDSSGYIRASAIELSTGYETILLNVNNGISNKAIVDSENKGVIISNEITGNQLELIYINPSNNDSIILTDSPINQVFEIKILEDTLYVAISADNGLYGEKGMIIKYDLQNKIPLDTIVEIHTPVDDAYSAFFNSIVFDLSRDRTKIAVASFEKGDMLYSKGNLVVRDLQSQLNFDSTEISFCSEDGESGRFSNIVYTDSCLFSTGDFSHFFGELHNTGLAVKSNTNQFLFSNGSNSITDSISGRFNSVVKTDNYVYAGGFSKFKSGDHEFSGKNFLVFKRVDSVYFTGIVDRAINKYPVSVYPNPSDGILKLNGIDKGEVQVYNILGEHVCDKSFNEGGVNLTSLESGVYIIRILDINNSLVQNVKWVKQ